MVLSHARPSARSPVPPTREGAAEKVRVSDSGPLNPLRAKELSMAALAVTSRGTVAAINWRLRGGGREGVLRLWAHLRVRAVHALDVAKGSCRVDQGIVALTTQPDAYSTGRPLDDRHGGGALMSCLCHTVD